jgi:hypothetical protein
MSSNRPYPAESWPDDRVAAKPPTLANSKLWGKCPREYPCCASNCSARAELSLTGNLVEGEQLVEAPQVQRQHGAEIAPDGIESAHHAGATAERDDCDAMLRAVPQYRGNLIISAGQQHRVGSILHTGVFAPQQIEGGLAAGVQQSVPVIDPAVAWAHDGAQRFAVGVGQLGWMQRHLIGFKLGRRGVRHAQDLLQQRADALRKGSGFAWIAPGIPLHRGEQLIGHALQYYICCQPVTHRRTSATGFWRPRRAVWSTSVLSA